MDDGKLPPGVSARPLTDGTWIYTDHRTKRRYSDLDLLKKAREDAANETPSEERPWLKD